MLPVFVITIGDTDVALYSLKLLVIQMLPVFVITIGDTDVALYSL